MGHSGREIAEWVNRAMSTMEKDADGHHRNKSGDVMVSQPTLLTSGASALLREKPSLVSQSMSEYTYSTEPVFQPPPQNQSSNEYKYNMSQLLKMAEEERSHNQHPSDPVVQIQQHQQHQQLYAQRSSQVPLGYPCQQQQSQQTSTPFPYNAPSEPLADMQHGSSFQAHHKPLHEPLTSPPQTSYQTLSSSKFEVLPHTVPLAAGVDRLDPVIVQQLVKSGQCVLVDVRGDDRAAGTIEGSVHVPAIDTVPLASRIPDCVRQWANQPLVIFHCQYSAHRAPQTANFYREQAPVHQRVAILDGGFRGWESLGLPVQQGKQGLGCQQNANMYAVQQGMQFAFQQRTH